MGYLIYQTLYGAFISWFYHFLDSGAELCQIFCWFFGKFKQSKKHSEVIWPLAGKLVQIEGKDGMMGSLWEIAV